MVKEVDGQMHRSGYVDRDLLIRFLQVEVVHIQRSLNTGIVYLSDGSVIRSDRLGLPPEIAHETVQLWVFLDSLFDEVCDGGDISSIQLVVGSCSNLLGCVCQSLFGTSDDDDLIDVSSKGGFSFYGTSCRRVLPGSSFTCLPCLMSHCDMALPIPERARVSIRR